MVTKVSLEDAMDDFRSTAFYLTLWYAVLTTIVSVLVIASHDLALASALLAAATLALLFALILMAWAGRLSEQRITRSQFWHALAPQKRPAGDAGPRMACRVLEETWLRFAKGAAAVAIVMGVLAYASQDVSVASWTPSATAQPTPGSTLVSTYRNGRLLPKY
jgi:hypothetical protein